MLIYLFSFISGVAVPLWSFYVLLPCGIVLLLAIALVDYSRGYKFCWVILLMGLGWCWSHYVLQREQAWQLPEKLINRPIPASGIIASLPKQNTHVVSFNFYLQWLNNKKVNHLVRLAWYTPHPTLQVGERWQFRLKLKPPHGLHNPVGFDYLRWLKQHDLQATGYVVKSNFNHLQHKTWHYPIVQLRQHLQHLIFYSIHNPVIAAIITALSLGSRNGFTLAQWQVFQFTGTSHLVAISGLHISLVAGLVFWVVNFFWGQLGLTVCYPSTKAAAIASMLAAFLYALLSGFGLPAERTLIMLSILLASQLLPIFLSLFDRIILALAITVIFDPLSLTSASFGLSFVAVIFIAFMVTGRLHLSRWRQWWRLQLGINLGLLPLTLWFFQQSSMISLLVNLVAIPWVGFLVVPLCLLGCCGLLISPVFGSVVLKAAAFSLQPLWFVLSYLAHQPWVIWQHSISIWVMLVSEFGIILLLIPFGLPGRLFGIIFLLPLFFWHPARPAVGELYFTLLDVGQGLASVIETKHHVLVYDTGPHSFSGFDAGQEIVLPYLRYLGWQHLDKLIVSHGDNDHSGGAKAILNALPTKEILTSLPKLFPGAKHCWQGQHWQWDGVKFAMLYPPKGQAYLDNNSSCVLKITAGTKSLLLVGDIEAPAETALLQHNPKGSLQANILVAPHHGSKTSSSPAFVAAVDPGYVLFPTGYLNRYQFPSSVVIDRYRQIDSHLYNTAQVGAIQIRLSSRTGVRLAADSH